MIRAAEYRNTKQWIAEHAQELAASGMIDLIRRRSAVLLATSELTRELERFGARPIASDSRELDSADARHRLLAAWADAEAAKSTRDSLSELPAAASRH